jgi:hypothetical protein
MLDKFIIKVSIKVTLKVLFVSLNDFLLINIISLVKNTIFVMKLGFYKTNVLVSYKQKPDICHIY